MVSRATLEKQESAAVEKILTQEKDARRRESIEQYLKQRKEQRIRQLSTDFTATTERQLEVGSSFDTRPGPEPGVGE